MHPSDLAGEETLWTVADVARFLRVSRSWVYGNAQSGVLPSVKMQGARRFEPAAIRAWLDRQRSGPGR